MYNRCDHTSPAPISTTPINFFQSLHQQLRITQYWTLAWPRLRVAHSRSNKFVCVCFVRTIITGSLTKCGQFASFSSCMVSENSRTWVLTCMDTTETKDNLLRLSQWNLDTLHRQLWYAFSLCKCSIIMLVVSFSLSNCNSNSHLRYTCL